ncbi:MAG TPA: zinc-dependent alcohol dehydrogenase family protein [Propionicimonas sp.]|uniref:zinc-dependent alcohol dehydrogenase family protein n=1 Tax=Propionicimonas sp. TaxID=1955623 RepID=UPI002F3F601D
MYGAVIHAPGVVRYEEREDPTIIEPTDAIVRTVAACVCGSDLWRYRGISAVPKPTPIGHEYCGVVEAIGDAVTSVKVGDFVVGGFLYSDDTCPVCRKGAHANCQHGGGYAGCQADKIRVPQADGTLVATPELPADDLIPSILALSDVMCTGWHAAVSAGVGPGTSVVVVGDGAVGLSAILSAVQLGATTVIAMSRHADRQAVATAFGATHIIAERGEEGVAKIKELTDGIGADCVLECVGTEDARLQAVGCVRDGGNIGLVGVPHGELPVDTLFWRNVGIKGGPAHVRAYLPHLLDLVLARKINPGLVFDLDLPLSEIAEAYAAMDERRAIKSLVRP